MRQGVVAVVRREDGSFLMIRRAQGILAGGSWCFVGGGLEDGETQAEAVAREFHEEVGGSIRPVEKVWEYVRPDGQLKLHWWSAILEDAALVADPTEVAEFRWCTAEEVGQLDPVLASNLEFLEVYRQGQVQLP